MHTPAPKRQSIADRLAARARLSEPGRPSAWFARAFDGWLGRFLTTWFRPSLEGLEHFPRDRAYLVVANHSGGGLVEVLCLAYLWHREFRGERPITGMTHPIALHLPIVSFVVRELGAIPSTYEAGLAALKAGMPVLVFPGGDHEGFRPFWQVNRVDFAGRKGFLRLAREARVPIVPLGIRGSHLTIPILWRSRLLSYLLVFPRLLGTKRLPVSVGGAAGLAAILAFASPALGWGWSLALGIAWALSPLPALFLVPARIRIRVAPPLSPEALFGDTGPDGPLDAPYARVEDAVRTLVRTREPME